MINNDIGLRCDLSVLKIDKGDTIILTFDSEVYEPDAVQQVMQYLSEQFYDNHVIAKIKGLDIDIEKSED
jgi:cyclophilin family peptidyl-prolyl cis-trans isomerase